MDTWIKSEHDKRGKFADFVQNGRCLFQQSLFFNTDSIDRRAFDLLNLLASFDIEARLVGGCVRDALLAQKTSTRFCDGLDKFSLHSSKNKAPQTTNKNTVIKPPDIDIAANCLPTDLIRFCLAYHYKFIPTGIDHGTITILFKGLAIEVTSLRSDRQTHGRRAKVCFGTSFIEDAKRRDFTFNALYVDRDSILYDAFNGADDLIHGRLRFIGSAHTRIAEDYLRLFRYFRFWARFSRGPVNVSVLPPLAQIKDKLSILSIERIQKEVALILTLPWPGVVIQSMHDYGIWAYLFNPLIERVKDDIRGGSEKEGEGWKKCDRINIKALRRLIVIEHLWYRYYHAHMPQADSPVFFCPVRRLCILTNGADPSRCLKLSRRDTQKLKALSVENVAIHANAAINNAVSNAAGNGPAWNRGDYLSVIAFKHPQFWIDAHLILWALSGEPSASLLGSLKERVQQLKPVPPFPLRGKDIVQMGVSGVEVGKVLAAVKRLWIEKGFALDRRECREEAERILLVNRL